MPKIGIDFSFLCKEVISINVYYAISNQNALYHHGVLGQKWGARRYQNKDGTRTAEGKQRAETNKKTPLTPEQKAARKKKRLLIAAGVVTTGVILKKIRKVQKEDPGHYKNLVKKGASAVASSAAKGIKEGVEEGPKKAIKAVVVGASMLGAKKLLDMYAGKDVAGQIMNANNSKKIGSFWQFTDNEGRKDDDD